MSYVAYSTVYIYMGAHLPISMLLQFREKKKLEL